MKQTSTLSKQIHCWLVKCLILLVAIGLLVACIAFVSLEGWNNNQTMTLLYSVVTPFLGVVFYFPLSRFLVNRDKRLIHIKIQIHRSLEKAEAKNKLDNLEKLYLGEQAEECVRYINEILLSKGMNDVSLDKIDTLFDEFGELKDDEGLRWFETMAIRHKYKIIKCGSSPEFDELFRSYKNRELTEKPHFPFLEMLLPLVISIVGLFATIYQALAAEGPLVNPLLDYFKVFGRTIFLASAFAIYGLTRGTEFAITKHQRLLEKIQKATPHCKKETESKTKNEKPISSRTQGLIRLSEWPSAILANDENPNCSGGVTFS